MHIAYFTRKERRGGGGVLVLRIFLKKKRF